MQFFVNYAPYDVDPKVGNWGDVRFKDGFADRVFRIVDEYCPGFSSSVYVGEGGGGGGVCP